MHLYHVIGNPSAADCLVSIALSCRKHKLNISLLCISASPFYDILCASDTAEADMQARAIWHEMFSAEAFDLEQETVPERAAELQSSPPSTSFQYKIADAVDRQQAFWYQVCSGTLQWPS